MPLVIDSEWSGFPCYSTRTRREQVRSYKPAHGHFLAARERLGSLRWLHAAQSNFHDIVPTNALGITNAWVNRRGDTALPGGTPAYEVRDLTGLADLLA